jgi:Terminase RNaseH-like domain
MPDPSAAASFFLGLDLGQAADYSALIILESADAEPPRSYAGRHLQRFPLRTAYPDVAQEVAALAEALALAWPRSTVRLAVDATGVGRAVVDLLKREPMPHVRLTPITITAGLHVAYEQGFWHVPKQDLVGTAQVCLQAGRLKIASALPESQTLVKELQNYQMKITLTTGHDSYGAWREGTHDDLVLALACALWCGERRWPRWAPVGT